MNILFISPTDSLNLFHRLLGELSKRGVAGRAGFAVAHAGYYEQWLAANPEFEAAGHTFFN